MIKNYLNGLFCRNITIFALANVECPFFNGLNDNFCVVMLVYNDILAVNVPTDFICRVDIVIDLKNMRQ